MGSRGLASKDRNARSTARSQAQSLKLDREIGLYPSLFTYQSAPRLRISPARYVNSVYLPALFEWFFGHDTSKSGTGEIAADDGDCFTDSARALGFVEAVFAFGEGCVEECKTWGWGLGDGGVLGAGEEGERGQGQYFLEIHC